MGLHDVADDWCYGGFTNIALATGTAVPITVQPTTHTQFDEDVNAL